MTTMATSGRTLPAPRALRATRSLRVVHPGWDATIALLFGLLVTGFSLGGDVPSDVARRAAIGCGLSLLIFAFAEVRRSWENLLRADLVCMAALYYLLFLEFLFAQPNFDAIARNTDVLVAVRVVLASMAAMAIGRHGVSRATRSWSVANIPLRPSTLLLMFWICFATGFVYMLAMSDWNPVTMVGYFLAPRFSEPWAREQFGNLHALLYELGAVIYLVPPLAGIILGRRRSYSTGAVVMVSMALLFTLFYGFTTGTRSIIGAYLITFLVPFYYASSASRKMMVPIGVLAALVLIAATVFGVQFRTHGLRSYMSEREFSSNNATPAFFVDYNLYSVSQLVTVFPIPYPYLGLEVPKWVLFRDIPRAFWPGKPDGSIVSPNAYLDVAPGTTISTTFIGEAYMGAGLMGALVAAFGLGFLAMWWTRKAFVADSDFGILFYGSGFFAVVTTMRSLYMLPVAVLPTVALAALASFMKRRRPPVALPAPSRNLQAG
jgi:hypothetical protein